MRSIYGNLPHILKRISGHKKALAAALSSGLARHHRANPAASLKTEKLIGLPVLQSGVAALTLLKSEVGILSQHYKHTLEGLLKIHKKTPAPFVFFVAGSLPFQALLDIKQLGLFGMVCRLENNILHTVARYVLTTCADNSSSWFIQIKELCHQYQLPHPLTLLESSSSKETFKQLVKARVHDFWEEKLRHESSQLDSLVFFKPDYMSLSIPHPLITTCGSNPYEINKAVIQLKFLSGRYRTDKLLAHFHKSNSPTCQLSCDMPDAPGDLQHLLVQCSALSSRRDVLFEYWDVLASTNPVCTTLVKSIKQGSEEMFVQFLLDCTVVPEVSQLTEDSRADVLSTLFKMTRTYCYSIHRERLKLLNRWRS